MQDKLRIAPTKRNFSFIRNLENSRVTILLHGLFFNIEETDSLADANSYYLGL